MKYRLRYATLLGPWPYDLVSFVSELRAGLSASELPIDGDAMTVHSAIPGARFLPQFAQWWDSAMAQALPAEQAHFDFRLVRGSDGHLGNGLQAEVQKCRQNVRALHSIPIAITSFVATVVSITHWLVLLEATLQDPPLPEQMQARMVL